MPAIRENAIQQPYTKRAGWEPIPGYALIEPLGRGGFGEVWKCEAPGGLHKAIKFVSGETAISGSTSDQLRQEYHSFQRVKAIRHPFLLSLERVELVGNDLIIVMELADKQLADRFHECVAERLPGIPREELLGYAMEAAEALDLIGGKHGLQHLDVKPANLFLTSGHVQVGDFGLVSKLDGGRNCRGSRGFTASYASPEVLQGQIHARSDQYSLALAYYELLTGGFPFSANTTQQMIGQHLSAAPDLSRLPERDRPAVGRALSKRPEERFPSCLAFVRGVSSSASAAPSTTRLALITPSKHRPTSPQPPTPEPLADRTPPLGLRIVATAGADRRTAQELPAPAAASVDSTDRVGLATRGETAPAQIAVLTAEDSAIESSPERLHSPFKVKLDEIRSLFPVEYLQGECQSDPERTAEDFVRSIVAVARAKKGAASGNTEVVQHPDGSWSCRFLSSIDRRVAKVKLQLLKDETGVEIDNSDPGRVVFRKPVMAPVKSGFFGSTMQETNSGLEVCVQFPVPGRGTSEVVATGNLYGNPPADFAQAATPLIGKLLEGVREQLHNLEERRKHPRIRASFPISLYPLQQDGTVEAVVSGRCKDVSEGGLALFAASKPATRYAYVAFDEAPGAAGLAVLIQLVRSEQEGDESLICGRYRLDFGADESSR
jgi:serine/threonine protein kinase